MSDIALFDFVPDLPVLELHAELHRAREITALGKRKLALYLDDMQERGVHIQSGHASAVHFAASRLQMDKRRAQEYVTFGHRLRTVPEVDAALVAGDLSWSKVNHILRVVVPETQSEWIARAEESSCRELSLDVSRVQRGDRPRERNDGGLPRQQIKVTVELDVVEYEIWEQARRKVSAEGDHRMTAKDMLMEVARLILRTDDDETQPGRTKVKHSMFQLIVHEDAEGSHYHTALGSVRAGAWMSDYLRREAEVVPFARSVDENGKTPPDLARRILARDGRHCQSCSAILHLHVHHVVFRARGGKTNENNLLTVCTKCHSMIHQGLLHIHGDGVGGYFFLGGDGDLVDREKDERLRSGARLNAHFSDCGRNR